MANKAFKPAGVMGEKNTPMSTPDKGNKPKVKDNRMISSDYPKNNFTKKMKNLPQGTVGGDNKSRSI